jgi:FtsP/CotA-like multicopper oxidase with cupredoxin domain
MKNLFLSILCSFSVISYSQQVTNINLAIEMLQTMDLDGGGTTEFWGYGLIKPNGNFTTSIPGPVLEINLGDSVYISAFNDSPEDHTIHLHGLDVNQANDGVPSTSFAIDPDETAVYAFTANHTGIFLYHCHVLTTLHLTMGMYGMIVVSNYPNANTIFDGGPSFNGSYNFLTSDMDRTWNDNTLSIPDMFLFKANYFMVNGKSGNQLYNDSPNQVQSYVDDTTVLRLGNMAYNKTRYIFPSELNAKAYMSDGRVLTNSFDCDTLIINSGERYTVVLVPTENINTDIQVEYYEARNGNLEHTNLIKLNGDLSVPEAEIGEYDVYPNPTTDILNFRTKNFGDQIEIYDLSGKLIKTKMSDSFNTAIDLSTLNNGVYLLKYLDKTLKLVKQ